MCDDFGTAANQVGDLVVRRIHLDPIDLAFAVADRFAGTGVFAHAGHRVIDLLDPFDMVDAMQGRDHGVGVDAAAGQAEADHGHGNAPGACGGSMLSSAMHLQGDG
jgi:hypothetical protein